MENYILVAIWQTYSNQLSNQRSWGSWKGGNEHLGAFSVPNCEALLHTLI